MTEYVPRFIDGITIDEINAELKDMAIGNMHMVHHRTS